MSIPQIDWQNKHNIVEETKNAYLEWGFAQYVNVWDSAQNKTFDDWFKTLREWFYSAEDKNDWLSRGNNLLHGFVPIEGEILNPHRKNDYKEQFNFSSYRDVPTWFEKDLKQIVPLINEAAFSTIKVFEKVLNTENNY